MHKENNFKHWLNSAEVKVINAKFVQQIQKTIKKNKMKKIAFLVLAALGLHVANAQDSDKSFRFGLRLDPSINWYKVDNDKKFESGGTGIGFGWGGHFEIKLGDNASWANGIGLFYDKGKINYALDASTGDSVYYLLNGSDELVEFPGTEIDDTLPTGTTLYRLGTRTYSVNYVHLQTGIKMKTKEIGMITYFGQFGLNLGIKTKARATDMASSRSGYSLSGDTWTTESEKEDIDVTKDAGFMKLGINIGFGLEFNISGSTSAFACVSYNHGFTNAVANKPDYIKTTDDTDHTHYPNSSIGKTLTDLDQKFTARNIALTIGILF